MNHLFDGATVAEVTAMLSNPATNEVAAEALAATVLETLAAEGEDLDTYSFGSQAMLYLTSAIVGASPGVKPRVFTGDETAANPLVMWMHAAAFLMIELDSRCAPYAGQVGPLPTDVATMVSSGMMVLDGVMDTLAFCTMVSGSVLGATAADSGRAWDDVVKGPEPT